MTKQQLEDIIIEALYKCPELSVVKADCSRKLSKLELNTGSDKFIITINHAFMRIA